MSVSDNIGGFDWLSIWNLHPLVAGLVAFAVQFGVVWVLMKLEDARMAEVGNFDRGQYLNFLTNNGFLLPLWATLVAVVVRQADGIDIPGWWYWLCLVIPLVVWIALDRGNFETAQYSSPSKLAHTVAVVPMGYWIVAPLPAFLVQLGQHPSVAGVVAVLAIVAACIFWGPYGDAIKYKDARGEKTRIEPHVKWDPRTWTARPVYSNRFRLRSGRQPNDTKERL